MAKRKSTGFRAVRSEGARVARKGTTAVSRAVGKLQPLAPGLGPILGRFWTAISIPVFGFLRAIPGFNLLADHVERAGTWFGGVVAGLGTFLTGLPAFGTKLAQGLVASSAVFSGVVHDAVTAVTSGGVALKLGTAVVALAATAAAFVLSGGAPDRGKDSPTTGTGARPTIAAGGTAVEPVATPDPPVTYADSIAQSRAARVKRLTSDTGWLTVAGLFWLEPDENTFGTDSSNTIILPPGSAPGRCGVLVLEKRRGGESFVRLVPAPGAGLLVGDSAAVERDLRSDKEGAPDMLRAGRLQLFVIERGERLAIRMRDPEAQRRKEFTGIDFYPVDPALRVEAVYKPFDTPRMIPVPNFMGYSDSMIAPGLVTFSAGGTTSTLTPVLEDPADSTFFFIFADSTTEIETYGGGRFLYATPRADGVITLDFNAAYNPPCAFTPFTTCPMPPEGNRLAVPIRAGEKMYAGHDPSH